MSLDGNTTAGSTVRGKINSLDVLCIDAYAIAVKNGFDGTEEEWLASLKGEKGDPGPGAEGLLETMQEIESSFDSNTSVNLLDLDAVERDRSLPGYNDGELDWGDGTTDYNTWASTGYMPVSPGDTLTYQRKNPDTGEREICEGVYWCHYDADKNEIENYTGNVAQGYYMSAYLPDNAISEEMAIVKDTEIVPYKPYGVPAYVLKPESLPDGFGADITVDTELSTESKNPVQNKVVAAEIENLNQGLQTVSGQASNALVVANAAGQTATTVQGEVAYIITPRIEALENIGAVPEDETFDRAVAETIVGKNILNVDAAAPDPDDPYSGGFWRGKLFADDGTISTNAAACITDFIPISIDKGAYMVFSSNYTGTFDNMTARRIMGYDADKNLVGLLKSSVNLLNCQTALDSGAVYVRMQFTTTYVDADGQIEYAATGTGRTEYEPYTETVVEGGYTLKPECLPAEFDELAEQVDELTAEVETLKNTESSSTDVTLAIDKARFDGRFNYVAYSTLNGFAFKQNCRELFASAAKKAFTALKGDVEVTSDGKLIMCHDEGFTLDEDGYITTYDSTNATAIHDMTEAECLALQHAPTSSGTIYSVCGFEEYVRICKKYGKIAYITVRNHYVDEYVPELLRVLRKYGMVKQCIISGYPSATPLQTVRAADQNIMLAYVLGKSADITTDNIDLAISLGNMLICGFNFTTYSTTDDVATNLAGSLAAIEYAHDNDIRVYECQVGSMEVADKLMEYGITGAQIMFNPSFE